MGQWKQRRSDRPFEAAYRILEDQKRRKESIERDKEARKLRRIKEREALHAERLRKIREHEDAIKAEELERHLIEAAPHGFIDVQAAEQDAESDNADYQRDEQRRQHRASQQRPTSREDAVTKTYIDSLSLKTSWIR